MAETNPFNVGDTLHYSGPISMNPANDLPQDAIERDVEVTDIEEDGTVHITYGDGLVDWLPWQNLDDADYKKVT